MNKLPDYKGECDAGITADCGDVSDRAGADRADTLNLSFLCTETFPNIASFKDFDNDNDHIRNDEKSLL